MTGMAVASLRADVGPAIGSMTSRAQFSSQKRFHFDGVTFRSEVASTAACNKTTIDRVSAHGRLPS